MCFDWVQVCWGNRLIDDHSGLDTDFCEMRNGPKGDRCPLSHDQNTRCRTNRHVPTLNLINWGFVNFCNLTFSGLIKSNFCHKSLINFDRTGKSNFLLQLMHSLIFLGCHESKSPSCSLAIQIVANANFSFRRFSSRPSTWFGIEFSSRSREFFIASPSYSLLRSAYLCSIWF